MEASELLYKVADFVPVDISKVEASDSIQSHLSTMNSAKRLRNAPVNKSVSPHSRMPDQSARGFVQAIFLPNHLTLPTAHTPIRPTRPSCFKFPIKYGVLLYCFLSCVITSVRLYINIYGKKIAHDTTQTARISGLSVPFNNGGNASLAHYLTRMLVTSSGSVTLEPFILSNMHPNSSVTLCAWASDSEFESLDKNWLQHWHGSVSLLITTTAVPSSMAHNNLLIKIRSIRSHAIFSGLSIHILHIPSGQSKSPNMYLNLARLFAMTEWTLIFPGDISAQLHPQLYANIASRQLASEQVHLLTSEAHSYPFQPLSPLLLANDRDFWCTERFFLENSRVSDWDECLWQLSLETFGEIEILDAASSEYPIVVR
ncbi:hypothetical protein BYT27DRAFT_7140941 [Phlegmacium glaucopus]|nr:hypothetical protein BYT27DRAFT_7140941 [Phlegmacium glaucopus]